MTFDAMDLRMLRVFQAVVEAGGLSAAQGVLNLSLATISTQLSALETRLGVRLCRRGRGGFVLTPEGRAVYEEYGRLAGSIGQFEARVRRLKGELTGTFAVGLADNTISDPAAPLERLFARFADAAVKADTEARHKARLVAREAKRARRGRPGRDHHHGPVRRPGATGR